MANEAHYLDASALLSVLYRIPGATPFELRDPVLTSSELVRIELALALDRRRRARDFDSVTAAALRRDCDRLLGALHLFPVSDEVLEHASQPFALDVSLRTALHVATAQVVRAETAHLRFWTTSSVDAAAAVSRELEVAGFVPPA